MAFGTGVSSGSDGRVLFEVGADTRPFDRAMSSLDLKVKQVGTRFLGLLSTAGLGKFTAGCIELASDLTEVQNVVDVTFSTMSAKMDAWAASAAESYGLSETMAKRFAGTYGSMADAFGFTEEQAYAMSTALTALAGDVASFYNLSQDVAYTKLKSVFSGETETLKDLGIVMTQTALDAYAMANGWGATTDKMTEAEKVALRYAFIQDKLSNAQGDFARTSGSWANQVRLLQLRFETLRATLGQAFIAALLPVVKVINGIIAGLTQAAKAVNRFIEAVAGKSMEELTGGASAAVVDLGDVSEASAGSAADLADAQEDAAKAAKAQEKAQKSLNKTLAGFDRINRLESKKAKEKAAKSGTGVAGLAKLDSMLGLGDAVAGEAAKADAALAGVDVPPRLLAAVGRLKDALSELFGLIEGAGKWAWENILEPLGEWTLDRLAPAVVDLLAGAFRVLCKVLKALAPFAQAVWEHFLEPLANLAGDAIVAVLEGLAGALNAIADFAERHPKAFSGITGGLLGVVGASRLAGKARAPLAKLATAFLGSKGLKGVFKLMKASKPAQWLGSLLKRFPVKNPIVLAITGVALALGYVYKNWGRLKKTKVGQAVEKLRKKLEPIAGKVGDALMKLVGKLAELGGKLWKAIQPMVEKALPAILDWAGKAADALGDGLVAIIEGLCDAIDALSGAWNAIGDRAPVLVAEAREKVSGALAALSAAWDGVQDRAAQLVAEARGVVEGSFDTAKKAFDTAGKWLKDRKATITGTLKGVANKAWATARGAFDWAAKKGTAFVTRARTVTGTVKASVAKAWNAAKSAFSWAKNGLYNKARTITGTVSATVSSAWANARKQFEWAKKNLKDITARIGLSISSNLTNVKGLVNDAIASINAKLHTLYWPSVDVAGKKFGGGQVFPGSASNWPVPQLARGGWVDANTPQLAVIGDNRHEGEVVSPESKLEKMARDAAAGAGSDNSVLEALLRELIAVERSRDGGVYLDGRAITRAVVREVNRQTQATGRCPIVV